MNKLAKKMLAAGICGGLAVLTLTGCSSLNKNDVLITMDDAQVKLGEAAFWLRYNQANTEQYLGGLFGDGNMWEQDLFGMGVPYGDSMKTQLLSELEEMVIMEQHAGEYDVELTAEDEEAIAAATQEFLSANSANTLKAMYADEETVARMLSLYTIHERVQAAVKREENPEITDEEAAQKTIEYVTFSTAATTDDEGNTVELTAEEIDAIEQQAKDVIAAVQGGQTMEEAVQAVDEEKSVNTLSYGEDDTTMSEELKTAADALTDGEIAAKPVDYGNGWYVVRMVTTFDEEATAEKKEELVEEGKEEHLSEVLEGWQPENVKVDNDLWEKLTFDVGFNAPETESETGSEAETSEAVSEEESSETETSEAVSEEETSEAASEEESSEAETSEAASEEETSEAASEEETSEADSE